MERRVTRKGRPKMRRREWPRTSWPRRRRQCKMQGWELMVSWCGGDRRLASDSSNGELRPPGDELPVSSHSGRAGCVARISLLGKKDETGSGFFFMFSVCSMRARFTVQLWKEGIWNIYMCIYILYGSFRLKLKVKGNWWMKYLWFRLLWKAEKCIKYREASLPLYSRTSNHCRLSNKGGLLCSFPVSVLLLDLDSFAWFTNAIYNILLKIILHLMLGLDSRTRSINSLKQAGAAPVCPPVRLA